LLTPALSQTVQAAEPVLHIGDVGPAVKTLETGLKKLSLYHGAIDGIFGPGVKQAVVALQHRDGIVATGIVGPSTWHALWAALHPPATRAAAAGLIREGDTGPQVTHVQDLLREVGAHLGATGHFGPETETAVVAFQRSQGLRPDGVVGINTMRALAAAIARLRGTLQEGDRGPAVRTLQRELNELGYGTGGIDGVYGPATKAAVQRFEQAEGLTVNGIAGPSVNTALMRVLETSTDRGMTVQQSVAAAIVGFARQYIGSPYSWGGASPATGFDCSGFVQFVFSHFNIQLPRTSYQQYEVGTHVSVSELQPGDLVFFATDGPGASHVGIYIGGGNFIAADTYATGVRVDHMTGYWMSSYVGATIPPGL
jgi:peptidoglycan hydrolase-like protein with peptidoglycan-binding domain